MEERIAESSSSISLFSSFCEKSIGNEDDRGYVTRSWPYWRRASALNPLKSAGRRVKQLYTCTVRAIDDHRGRHLVQFEFRLKLFYTEITAAWKFDEFSKILNYTAYFNNFKFNWGIRDPRKDRQCLALYHSPRPLFLSLSVFLARLRSSGSKGQGTGSGTGFLRYFHTWLGNYLFTYRSADLFFVNILRPNKRARRLEYLSLAVQLCASFWLHVTAIYNFLDAIYNWLAVIVGPRR